MRLLPYRRKSFWLLSLACIGIFLFFFTYSHTANNKKPAAFQLYNENDVAIKLRSNHKQAEYIDKKGVHVVVGKYVGDSLSNDPQITHRELNMKRHAMADPKAGLNGEPVFTTGDARAKRLWHINKFNIVASDRIPLNRTLPDVRKPACRVKPYEKDQLPTASVIIVFHNEAWSTLLRTVQSAIDRSPVEALKEIILVDDASNRTFLGRELEAAVRLLPVPVQLLRAPVRSGLIQARLLGAARSKGDALVFLDAHCECTAGWLEPLLARLHEERTALVCPVIDIISDDTFAYVKSFSLHWGAFNWELHFRWFTMGKKVLDEYQEDITRPYRTPAMAGGLFAVDRAYFYELGSYDEAMDIWGGENLELSFRAWMCGGSVEIAPCSHVGHVFRKASPYSFPREGGVGAVLHRNLARVALVWMDEFKDFYFKVNPLAAKEAPGQNVTKRLQLREKLQCKSFQWYLDNIWPENFFPGSKRQLGKLRHRQTGLCLQKPYRSISAGSNQPSGSAVLDKCSEGSFYAPQLVVKQDGDTGPIMADESVCLDSPAAGIEPDSTVRFQACTEIERQIWNWDSAKMVVVHNETGKCLSHPTAGTSDILTLQECTGKTGQQWKWEAEEWR